jgi:hypothetical protein
MGPRRVGGALAVALAGALLVGCGAGSSKIVTPGSAPSSTTAPTTATTHSCAYPPCM